MLLQDLSYPVHFVISLADIWCPFALRVVPSVAADIGHTDTGGDTALGQKGQGHGLPPPRPRNHSTIRDETAPGDTKRCELEIIQSNIIFRLLCLGFKSTKEYFNSCKHTLLGINMN